MELNHTNQHETENYLNMMDERITLTLNNLLHDQSITALQWARMKPNRSNARLDSLYFLPDTRRVRHIIDLSLSFSIYCI
jgi:hypothetical protein